MSEIDLIQEWFRFALDDLRVAKHVLATMYPKPIEIVCYHCQQSAEKALKGFLIFKDIDPPKVHNLRLLCELCIEQDETFETILKICSDITNYGVSIRYPEEVILDEMIVKSAIQKVEMIYDFCWAKIPELSASEQ